MPKKFYFKKQNDNNKNILKKVSALPENFQNTNVLTIPSTSAEIPQTLVEPPIISKIPKSNYKTYLRLKRDFIRQKQLFVDVAFPPTNSSLFLDVNRSSDIIWKRPGVCFYF